MKKGEYVSIDDSYYYRYKLAVTELPKYSWIVRKIYRGIVTCEQLKDGKPYITIKIEKHYLNDQPRYRENN